MNTPIVRHLATALGLLALAAAMLPAQAATKTEIKLGNTVPYSGPASFYGLVGQAAAACFAEVNDKGGINGRKVTVITLDDALQPPKTVEQVRKMVEQEEVDAIINQVGTATASSVRKYLNDRKVPQLFVMSGSNNFQQPKDFRYSTSALMSYEFEARVYGQWVGRDKPAAKVAILYQNDDYGKDYLKGFEEGLGAKGSMVVSKVSYEVTDPTIDSQILTLKNSGANVFFNITTPKFAAQAIKKIPEVGWKLDAHYLNSVSASVGSVLKPAGLDNSVGLITTQYLKDPTDPAWVNDADFKAWTDWMKKYYPGGDLTNAFNVTAWTHALTMAQVLRQCGDNLTRDNVMKQAASLNMQNVPMLLPGVEIKTGPDDFYPVEKEQLSKFDGKTWVRFGKVYGK